MDGTTWINDRIDTPSAPDSAPRGDTRTETANTPAPLHALGAQRQHTLRAAIRCSGIGLHGGQPATLTLRPAPAGSGLVFRRIDLPAEQGAARDIVVSPDRVVDTRLCTTLANEAGTSVATVEHLMAALAALGIDNLLIEVDGPEIPIMDGSAQPFLFLIDCAGRTAQEAPRRAIRVLKPVQVTEGPVLAALSPAERGLSIQFEIDFAARAIGRQSCRLSLTPEVFRRHLGSARTFGLREDVERLHAAGLALGGSLDNAVVVDDDTILNEDGLRFDEEFVRHKALDAVGDLYMAGLPLIGRYQGVRSSHHHNNMLLRALLADPTAWRIETATDGSITPAPVGAEGFTARRDGPAPTRACA